MGLVHYMGSRSSEPVRPQRHWICNCATLESSSFHFEVVHIFELKRVGGVHKGHKFAPLLLPLNMVTLWTETAVILILYLYSVYIAIKIQKDNNSVGTYITIRYYFFLALSFFFPVLLHKLLTPEIIDPSSKCFYRFPLLKGKGYSKYNPYRGLKRIREDQITRITGKRLPLILSPRRRFP